jgi:class 3 adenylate cyclase
MRVLAGSVVNRAAIAGVAAQGNQVIISPEVYRSLGEILTARMLAPDFFLVEQLEVRSGNGSWPAVPAQKLPAEIAQSWMLPSIYARLQAGDPFLSDLRPATPLFIRFAEFAYDEDDEAGEKLKAYVGWAQSVIHQHGGALLQLTIDEKGNYLYATFGAPLAHGDDTRRAMAAALALQQLPAELDFAGPISIGLTRGQVWSGVCGASSRHCYAVMGNEVNLSARLMALARPGQILVSRRVVKQTGPPAANWPGIHFRELAAIQVKGRAEPLPVAEVVG